jgi:streptogramin lyase
MSVDRSVAQRAAPPPVALAYVLLAAALLASALVLVPMSRTAPWRVPTANLSIPVEQRPAVLLAADGALWVSSSVDPRRQVTPGSSGAISRVDPSTSAVERVSLFATPPADLALGAGALWAVDSQRGVVSRIDLATRQVVAAIVVGAGAQRIAVGDGAVWVAHRDMRVTRIDPFTNRVVARLDLGAAANWTDLAVTDGAVWLLNGKSTDPETRGSLARLDPALNQIVRTIPVGRVALGMAVDPGAIWVANAEPDQLSGSLMRIDPATNAVVSTIPLAHEPAAVAVGGGKVWVSSPSDQSVYWLDPITGRFDVTPLGKTPGALAFEGGALWVLAPSDGAILRVQP